MPIPIQFFPFLLSLITSINDLQTLKTVYLLNKGKNQPIWKEKNERNIRHA
jgi:hypothetical protein